MTRAKDISLTERDISVLGPLAEHRLLIVPQVAVLLAVGERAATRRLLELQRVGLLQVRRIFDGLPPAAAIRGRGLHALASDLSTPQVNLNQYRHEVGVGWLWLAARAGAFGPLRGLTAERRMQAEDAAAVVCGEAPPWGVGLGLIGGRGQPQRHHPDLMLDTASGHRVAVELELTAKSAGRMLRIMTAYASDARVDHVAYFVAGPTIAARVREAAGRAGIAARVEVRLLAPDGIAGAEVGRTRAVVAAGRAAGARRAWTGAPRTTGAQR